MAITATDKQIRDRVQLVNRAIGKTIFIRGEGRGVHTLSVDGEVLIEGTKRDIVHALEGFIKLRPSYRAKFISAVKGVL